MTKQEIAAKYDALTMRASELQTKINAGTSLTEDENTELRGMTAQIANLENAIANQKVLDDLTARVVTPQTFNDPKSRANKAKGDVDKLFDAYSVTRAAQLSAGNIKQSDAAAEVEVHQQAEEIARALGIPTTGQGILIMERSDFATALDAGNLGQTQTLTTIQGYQKKIFADQLGARMYMGLTGIAKLPVSDTTAVAAYVAENGSFAAVPASVRAKSLEPKAIMAKSTNGWYLKAQAGAEADRVLLQNLMTAEINAVNANLIKTIGAGPVGAFDDADITDVTTATGSAITRALLISLKNAAAANDAGGQNPAWILSPTIQNKLENLPVDAGSGLFVMDVNTPDRLMGYNVFNTTLMPINLTKGAGTNLQGVLFGYWDNLAIANWAVREIIVDKANSDLGVVTKILSFYDHAYANPKAFAKGYFTA
jgi:hypothetical protein